MGKTIFWVVVILGVLLGSRLLAHHNAKKRFREEQSLKDRQSNPLPNAEEMVRCSHCGVFLPRSDALMIAGQTWCSEGHAKLGPSKTH